MVTARYTSVRIVPLQFLHTDSVISVPVIVL